MHSRKLSSKYRISTELQNLGGNELLSDSESLIPFSPGVFVEEDPTSLWQYCIHKEGKTHYFDLSMTLIFATCYCFSFYAVVNRLLRMPIIPLKRNFSYLEIVWLSKVFIFIFLFVQAENECLDGWRMFKFAQGSKLTIKTAAFFQYFFGCLVEIVSYSLINRAETILDIMTNSAYMTIFLRMDDTFVEFMHKMFPRKRIKVFYDHGREKIDKRKEVYLMMFLKIAYFSIAETGLVLFDLRMFL